MCGNDDTKSYQSAVSKAANDESLSDKYFWSGYESASAAYFTANSDGVHHDYNGKSSGNSGKDGNSTPGGGRIASNDPPTQSTKPTVAQPTQKAPRKNIVTTPDDDPAFSSGFLTKKADPTPDVSLDIAKPAAPATAKPTAARPKQSNTTIVGMGLTSGADPRTQPGPVSTTQQIRNIEKAKELKAKKQIQDQKSANSPGQGSTWQDSVQQQTGYPLTAVGGKRYITNPDGSLNKALGFIFDKGIDIHSRYTDPKKNTMTPAMRQKVGKQIATIVGEEVLGYGLKAGSLAIKRTPQTAPVGAVIDLLGDSVLKDAEAKKKKWGF